jgi:hypothetical protein
VRPLWALAAFLAAGCPGAATPRQQLPDDPVTHTQLADEDRYTPTYGKPELSRALIAERGAEATAEKTVAELEAKDPRDAAADDKLRFATADLAVRRRFIASLEACESSGRWCPPRLDDPSWTYELDGDKPPPLDTPLRFDVDSWRRVVAELHGRACACRSIACVDGVGAAIHTLEPRPETAVQGDELVSLSLTRARECLFRLRGKSARARAVE